MEWVDIEVHYNVTGDAWNYEDDVSDYCDDPITSSFFSVGFVLKETEEHIYLTETIGIDRSGAVVKIPKGVIRNRWRLMNDDSVDGGQ